MTGWKITIIYRGCIDSNGSFSMALRRSQVSSKMTSSAVSWVVSAGRVRTWNYTQNNRYDNKTTATCCFLLCILCCSPWITHIISLQFGLLMIYIYTVIIVCFLCVLDRNDDRSSEGRPEQGKLSKLVLDNDVFLKNQHALRDTWCWLQISEH